MIIDNIIHTLRVKQNTQEFLVGVFTIQQLLTFTKYTERLIINFDENNYPIYNDQIQRRVEKSRIDKIADFLIDDPDAIFPTNIVLSIPNAAINRIEIKNDSSCIIEINNDVFSEIKRPEGAVYLTIIDGQHRIRGIERAIERLKTAISASKSKEEAVEKGHQLNALLDINLIVSFFIDPSLEFQAMIFATINRTQKSVSQNLVYSLFGLTERDTPQKTGLEIVLALNSFDASPFYDRIKLYGGDYGRNQSPPLTQSSMVKSIVNLISVSLRESESDRFRERSELNNTISDKLPFRRYYSQNKDQMITDILYSFFKAVQKVFVRDNTSLWDFNIDKKPKNILHTTVGYQALLQILVDILAKEKEDSMRDKVETYQKYLSRCNNLNFSDQQRYPFTSISKTILYHDMSLAIWPDDGDDRKQRLETALKNR